MGDDWLKWRCVGPKKDLNLKTIHKILISLCMPSYDPMHVLRSTVAGCGFQHGVGWILGFLGVGLLQIVEAATGAHSKPLIYLL